MAKLISNTYFNGEVTSCLYGAKNEADVETIDEDAPEYSIAFYKDGDSFVIKVKTEDGWQ